MNIKEKVKSLEAWRFTKKGNKATDKDRNEFLWYQHHGKRDDKGNRTGMLMPEPHNHAA